jgi:Holliday junction resolvase RusA-like endonuclease
MRIAFRVEGEARPAGSKTAIPCIDKKTGQPLRGPTGRIITRAVHPKSKTKEYVKVYMHRIGLIARENYQGPLLEGPLMLRIWFARPHPKCHYRSGRNAHLLDNKAPAFPITTPDSLKLARAIEDGCTGVIWRDDSQVCRHEIVKLWGDHYYADVVIEEMPTVLLS